MKFFGTKKAVLRRSPTRPLILPRVGPFASFASIDVTTLPNLALGNGFQTLSVDDTTHPAKYQNVTLSASTVWRSLEKTNVIWANKITGVSDGSFIGFEGDPGNGDDGGSGTSGGGGGGAAEEGENGWNGGSAGVAGDSGGFDNNGGQGFGQDWNSFAFEFGQGGDGGDGGESPTLGANFGNLGSGDSFGNAGGGGGGGAGTIDDGGGGGGGGPLIAVICNQLLGFGTFFAKGGYGFPTEFMDSGGGGGGGGGVIYVATKKYSGTWDADVSGGNADFGVIGGNGQARIYEITRAGILVLRDFSESWDNT